MKFKCQNIQIVKNKTMNTFCDEIALHLHTRKLFSRMIISHTPTSHPFTLYIYTHVSTSCFTLFV